MTKKRITLLLVLTAVVAVVAALALPAGQAASTPASQRSRPSARARSVVTPCTAAASGGIGTPGSTSHS